MSITRWLGEIRSVVGRAFGNERKPGRVVRAWRDHMHLRPSVEYLECRTLPTFTVNPTVTIDAHTGYPVGTGQIVDSNSMLSTSNPGSAHAAWQTSGQSVSTQGSASFQTTKSTFIVDESVQADEQFSAIGTDFLQYLYAETQIHVSGPFVLTSPSYVTFSGAMYSQDQYKGGIGYSTMVIRDSSTGFSNFVYQGQGVSDASSQIVPKAILFQDGQYTFDYVSSANSMLIGSIGESRPMSASLHIEMDVSPILADTTTVLASKASPTVFGQPVVLTATVAPSASGSNLSTPTGMVTIMDGAISLGSGTLNAGTFSLPISSLTPGTHSLTAVYAGDDNFSSSTSVVVEQTVAQAIPAVRVADAGGIFNGMPFSASATVAGTLAGVDDTPAASLEGVSPTFTYYSGNSALPDAPTAPGTYTVVATFSGSTDYTSASDTATFVIRPSPLPPPLPPIVDHPDVVVDSVATIDSRSLTVNYHVDNADVHCPLTIGFYRSPTATFDPKTASELTSVTDFDVSAGSHSDFVNITGGLQPDPALPYILAVADPDDTITESDRSNNTASFRTYVIGAVSVGFDPKAWSNLSPPQSWVTQMAQQLMNIDHYYAVIPFGWASGSTSPAAIRTAGDNLFAQIEQLALSIPDLQPNDVIDVHLIGHSRGSVVVVLC